MIRSLLLSLLLLLVACSPKKATQQVRIQKEIRSKGTVILDTAFILQFNDKLPSYRVRLVEGQDTSDEFEKCFYEIQIQHNISDSIVQTIAGKSSLEYSMIDPKERTGIDFVDLNFDGYLDIIMLNALSMNGINEGYEAYLFNSKDSLFYHNETFSGILGGTSYSLNPDDKTILSEGELGCMGHCFSKDTYKVVGDSLVLIKRTHKDQNVTGNPDIYLLIEEELVNGVLTIVKQDTVDY